MKATAQLLPSLLRDTARLSGFLFYGEDSGLVRQRAGAAVAAGIGSASSVFCETVLAREDHKALPEAATSPPLGGGRRVVRVQDAGDALVSVLERLLAARAPALLVLEAGSLTPRSKLRAFAERQAEWAAIACYVETGRAVSAEIEASLRQGGLRIDPEALGYLTAELSGDSARRRSELEKLALFAHGSGSVSLSMAQESCVVGVEATIVAAAAAALSGRAAVTEALLADLERDGASGPGLLAVLSGQVHRLLRVRAQIEAGRTLDEAIRGLQPPVYPSQQSAVARDAERWSVAALEAILRALREADKACKRAGSADFAIAARLLLSIASRRAGG